jgi:hypothetical protein
MLVLVSWPSADILLCVVAKTRLFRDIKEYFSMLFINSSIDLVNLSQRLLLFFFIIIKKKPEKINKQVDNKRMASEIPTHMLNPKKFVISDLKFSLRALVICGLFNTTKIVTRKEYIILLTFLVFCNSEWI